MNDFEDFLGKEALLEINNSLYTAPSKNARKRIIKGIKIYWGKFLKRKPIDKFLFYFGTLYVAIPEMLDGEDVILHEDLELLLIYSARKHIETGEDLLFYSKAIFPLLKLEGFNPFESDDIFKKIQHVLNKEAMLRVIGEGGGMALKVWKELYDYLVPYIVEAMVLPFAEEEMSMEDENGNFVPWGTVFTMLETISELLRTFANE